MRKVNFDDNAMFRHPDYKELRDLNEEEPLEIEASKFDLNYIKLDGTIGLHGERCRARDGDDGHHQTRGRASRRNFLDVGGGASQERVEAAFKILLADEHVKAVLINIFGGIVRCDMVARGVVGAAKTLGISIPVVVRLEGTNVEEGQRVIRESGLNFTVANGMKDAAEKVVGWRPRGRRWQWQRQTSRARKSIAC
jgi:succinyl-CoA synthetase beta subunit